MMVYVREQFALLAIVKEGKLKMVNKLKKKEKKKRTFLSSFSICFLVVLLAAVLSWIIPAGNYDTLVYDALNE